MCGISGIFAREPAFQVPAEWIHRMMNAQAHRGPDDAHVVQLPGCLLGFNRLSVQDVSLNGRQPMSVSDSRALIVFNGEIYNFIELAEEQRKRGIQFRSRSDTEVLLRSFLSADEECLQSVNGMFAFAIYDPDSQQLFAARDRFGEKPFYYYFNERFFCFASEIKALLRLPFVPRRPNLAVLFGAVFERRNDRSEETCFEEVLQVRPSHRLRISRRNWRVEERRYWSIQPREPEAVHPDSPVAVHLQEELRDLLRSSVAMRLRSDRPIGLLLSGGLDSSGIAATLRGLTDLEGSMPPLQVPRFYTMALPGEVPDESSIALDTANFLGIRCSALRCEAPDLERLVPATLWHNDEPLPYLNRCVHWHMMERIAQEGIIVVLNGQGGDETVGGYAGRLAGSTLAMALRTGGVQQFLAEWKQIRSLRGFSARWLFTQLPKPLIPQRWLRSFRGLTRERAVTLATLRFIEKGILRDHSPQMVRGDYVNDQLMRWLTRDTVPDLCHYEDRNSAAHGLEERFPFLDHRIAEFMFRLPWTFKSYHGVSKVLFRRSMEGGLPDAVINSHRKIGLEVPEDKWIRGPLRPMVQDLVAGRGFRERGLWRPSRVRSIIHRHVSGEGNYGNLIWRVIGTEMWFQMFIDGSMPVQDVSWSRRAALPR